MNALLALLALTAEPSGSGLTNVANLVRRFDDADPRSLSVSRELADVRLFVHGIDDGDDARQAVALALDAEWAQDGRRLLLRRAKSAVERSAAQSRDVRLEQARRLLDRQSERLRSTAGPKDRAVQIVDAVLAHVEGVRNGTIRPDSRSSLPLPNEHPLSGLLVGLISDVGAGPLATVPIGRAECWTTYALPGANPFPGSVSDRIERFTAVSRSVGAILGDRANSGDLRDAHGVAGLIGPFAREADVQGVSLIVRHLVDSLHCVVIVIREGDAEPLFYWERFPLDPPRPRREIWDYAGEPGGPVRRAAVEWSPATAWRYRLGNATRPVWVAPNAPWPASSPEALATTDVLDTFVKAKPDPVVIVVPAGLEANLAKPGIVPSIGLAAMIARVQNSPFAMEALQTAPILVLAPIDRGLLTLGPEAPRAEAHFVRTARQRGWHSPIDAARYLREAGHTEATLGEASWWRSTFALEGMPLPPVVAGVADLRLIGDLATLPPPGQSLQTSVLSLNPARKRAVAEHLWFWPLWQGGQPASSLHQQGGLLTSDWLQTEVTLDVGTEPAAQLIRKSAAPIQLRIEDLAAYVAQWRREFPETMDPSKLRLVEGTLQVWRFGLRLPDGRETRAVLTGAFSPGNEGEVVGIGSLSKPLRQRVTDEAKRQSAGDYLSP